MSEQSHKDEMSAALRGDFARLRARGVSTTIAPSEPGSSEAARPRADDAAPPPPPVERARRRGWIRRLR